MIHTLGDISRYIYEYTYTYTDSYYKSAGVHAVHTAMCTDRPIVFAHAAHPVSIVSVGESKQLSAVSGSPGFPRRLTCALSCVVMSFGIARIAWVYYNLTEN